MISANNFVSLCGHKTTTFFPGEGKDKLQGEKGTFLEFPTYSRTPRVEYIELPDDNGFSYRTLIDRVSNLPGPLPGKNLIVSRQVIDAVWQIAKRLIEDPRLANVPLAEIKAIKKLGYFKVVGKDSPTPSLKKVVQEDKEFFLDLKLYLYRDDLFSPGRIIRDKNNKTIAAYKLISSVH